VDISAWLRELGMERYQQAFQEGEVDPAILPELTDVDLKELGIPVGPRKHLLKAISALAAGTEPPSVGEARRFEAERLQPAAGPELDLAKAWADSKYSPALVYKTWGALYKAYASARKQFPDVDWISLVAILDIIALARAGRRRVDISCLAEEMGWPRTTALRRLQRYAGSGYLTLTREGRHTYVDNTPRSRRAALRMIDVLIDSIDHHIRPASDKQII
jgi:uncharacterized membrane protein